MGQAVKVGIFMTVALAVAAYLILRIEDFNPFAEGQRRVDAEFSSVAGLDDKASVRVAGVRVGRVDGIGLEGRQARVTLLLEQPLDLTEGTRARIANMGLLGDKYVELVLGPAGAPLLPEGAVLPGETPVSFDDAIAKLDSIGDSIQQVTGSLTGGEGQETPISRMIANLEATSSEIRELVAINRDQVSATVANFESFSATLARELPLLARQLEGLVTRVDQVVADNRDELAGSLENIEEVSAGLKVSGSSSHPAPAQTSPGHCPMPAGRRFRVASGTGIRRIPATSPDEMTTSGAAPGARLPSIHPGAAIHHGLHGAGNPRTAPGSPPSAWPVATG
jgi:phospholipid/cholesterol/gamma-HCH transport system substrate-binding protein